jgi:hypothetical protein
MIQPALNLIHHLSDSGGDPLGFLSIMVYLLTKAAAHALDVVLPNGEDQD